MIWDERKREAIRYMLDFAADKGRLPSTRELLRGLGLSSMSTAHRLRHGLISRGIVATGDRPVFAPACFKGFTFGPNGQQERVF